MENMHTDVTVKRVSCARHCPGKKKSTKMHDKELRLNSMFKINFL